VEAFINGSGACVPERVVANEEIAPQLGLTPEQIFKSSGIRRRRWAAPEQTTSSLGAAALNLALQDAGLAPGDVDYLLFGTMTPDRFIPGSATAVQRAAGLGEIPCLDIRGTCCNALYGVQLAAALVASGAARNVAVCLAEIQSPWLDLSPASGAISMLFGDGASALVVSGEGGRGSLKVLDVLLAADGGFVDDLGVRCPGTEFRAAYDRPAELNYSDHTARMNGQAVILHASRKLTASSKSVLERNGLAVGDVRWIVPHQANANLLAQLTRGLRFENESGGLISVLEEFGNTSSASMGIALDTLRRSGRAEAGDYLLLPAFGAGFTWGAGLCRAQ
jgi:3-oxoacyl-[acyl-carrier-protein] synthase-3